MTKTKKQIPTIEVARLQKIWHGLRQQRQWLRGSYGEYLIVFLVFTILTIAYTDFVAFHITTQLFAGAGDATAGFLWLNFADPSLNPFLSHSDFVNYPYGETLGGPTFITYTALWLPLRFLSFIFGPVAGLNLVTFWGFISAALAGYWLLKRLTGSIPVALFAGFGIAFVPYAVYNSSGHLAYIFSYIFVLIIAGFIALWRRPTKPRIFLFSLAIATAFYTDGYYVLLGSIIAIGLCVAGILFSLITRMDRGEFWKRIKALLLTILCLILLLSPILFVQLSQGGQIKQTLGSSRSDIGNEMRAYRSNVIDFISPARSNPFLKNDKDFAAVQSYKNLRSNSGENTNYIGFIVMGLSAIGIALLGVWFFLRKSTSLKRLDKSTLYHFIMAGCITVCLVPLIISFMFSPEVSVLGHSIPMPGALLLHYNIALWRVMSRFFVPLHALIVIFASLSLWVVLSTSRLRLLKRRTKAVLTWTIVGVLGLAMAVEYATSVHNPPYDFTKVASGYLWLKQQSDIKTIAELPVVDPLDLHTGEYVTAQIVHGKKLVNFKEPNDMRLTDTLGSVANNETIDWAYSRGAQAVITHGQKCSQVDWGTIIFKDETDAKKAMCIYRLDKPATKDTSFIRYGDGFAYSPNQPDPSVTVFGKGTGTFYVTDNSFTISNQTGSVHITGEITTSSTNDDIVARWSAKQNGKNVGSGDVRGKKSTMTFDANKKYPIELTIKPSDSHVVGLGEYTLINAKVTDR